jgi:hypothetical protein
MHKCAIMHNMSLITLGNKGAIMIKSNKSAKVKRSAHKMSVAQEGMSRLVIQCTEEEKMYIKMLAASERKTMSDYLLATPRARMPKKKCSLPGCDGIHKPNKLTEKVLRETDRGENLEHHDSLEDFWKSMGIDPHAKD